MYLCVILWQPLVVCHVDGVVLLLRCDHSHLACKAERLLEHVVGEHVERLLLLALHVDRPAAVGVPHQARDVRALDERVDRLARGLDRRDQRLEVLKVGVGAGDLAHVAGERDPRLLAHLRELGDQHLPPQGWGGLPSTPRARGAAQDPGRRASRSGCCATCCGAVAVARGGGVRTPGRAPGSSSEATATAKGNSIGEVGMGSGK